MKEYLITRVSDQIDWARIPALKVDEWQWQTPGEICMEAQLCHDGQNLHIRMRAWEGEVRAEHKGLLDMVCEDSCMEFFFRPMEDDIRYFNLEVNPNGVFFAGFGSDRHHLVRLILPENGVYDVRTERTEGGWTAQYSISADFIRILFPEFRLESGECILANCYKCGDLTFHPHYILWNRVGSEAPDFHRPESFGRMILG